MFLNGLGAIAIAITVAVVLVAKFAEGTWITPVLIPAMILMMSGIKRQNAKAARRRHSQKERRRKDFGCAHRGGSRGTDGCQAVD
jgi:hypothetical protein